MKIINLCPHDVSIATDGMEWTKPRNKLKEEARVFYEPADGRAVKDDDTGVLLPVKVKKFPRVVVFPGYKKFPAPTPGVIYIVSAQVREFLRDREDVYSPNSGPTAERVNGGVISVKELIGNV